MREKPTLLIVSDRGFDEQIGSMDAHKHYTNGQGEGQEDAYVNGGWWGSPYVGAPKPKSGRVSITDGVVHPKQLVGVSTKLGERREYLTQKFDAKGMRHIDGVEMATLVQKSLREAQAVGDNSLIVDNREGLDGTATIVNPKSLTESRRVAYAFFYLESRRVGFLAFGPASGNVTLRGRASVQVLEF